MALDDTSMQAPRRSVVVRPCLGRDEWPELVRAWRSAVEATHDFLTPEDVDGFEARMATEFLPAVELIVAEHEGAIVGFAGVADGTLEMLFVDAAHHGRGAGTALVEVALAASPGLHVDVNEQNPAALSFYERRGFVVTGRSALDGDGRPFPLVHMEHLTPRA